MLHDLLQRVLQRLPEDSSEVQLQDLRGQLAAERSRNANLERQKQRLEERVEELVDQHQELVTKVLQLTPSVPASNQTASTAIQESTSAARSMVKVPTHSGGAQPDLPGKRAGPAYTSDPRSELNLGGVNDTGEES
ncbi:uncharacterized protein EHS24_003152 [Apiotrichum porosum]|uniref:Uncharacterized protein n=1 Tax=Apiotrichum porosum TaxID=105984 RepID=A0A427XFI6_9TREE|nr:uncharacterized protein EHS24_003152 [Apiotrichum porosum]RSH77592.1 hypothetical protein EHS24_003152 [Apiotrichum porosum]